MDAYIGEIAALFAAFGFSLTSVCYTFAGRKINAVTSLAVSLPIAWILILGIHQLTQGELFPWDATPDRWVFLSASGILAFVISSYFILNGYQCMGPRLTMLVASFAPVLGAILAWIFLGQTLPTHSALGIAVVMLGVVGVVGERGNGTATDGGQRDMRRGILFACLGTLAQGTAFIFSSRGVTGDFPPISATLIRLTAGVVALWIFIAWQKQARSTLIVLKNDRNLSLQLTGAALFGPVISGSLLLLSFQFAPVGVSTTLSHTTAIMLIPLSYVIFHEHISRRAIIGTLVTIGGIAILFS